MNSSRFSFLSNITLIDNSPKERKVKGEKTPTNGADLRLFKDGSIYPSKEFVEKWDLEYKTKGETNYGLDFTPSQYWGSYPEDQPKVLFISRVISGSEKIDLFGSVKYNEDGTPKSSVMTQNPKASGIKLIELLTETYGELPFNDEDYIDLSILISFGVSIDNGIAYLPKMITRGPQKGNWTNVRREIDTVYPLTFFQEEETTEVEDTTNEPEAVDSFGDLPI